MVPHLSVMDLQCSAFLASSYPGHVEVRVVYSDKPGRPRYRHPERPAPKADTDLDDAKTRYIREVADEHPGFTPEEVHAQIRYRGRHDITKDMVRRVLATRRRTSSRWRLGR